jgi:osmotically-inducible protein OsmY
MQSALTTQLATLASQREDIDQVNVLLNKQGQATVEGRVASEATRKLVEMLVRLEPGVRSVKNQLAVGLDKELLLPPPASHP